MKKTALLTFAALFALTACGHATPYQEAAEAERNGYRSQQIETNRHRVSFAGNTMTYKGTVENYLLFRAAEITLENGADYFVLVERETERIRSRRSYAGGYPYGYGYFGHGFGHHGFGHGYGYGYGYGGLDGPDKFEAEATILVFSGEKPKDKDNAHDARDVIKRLGPTIVRPEDLPS